MQDFGVSEMNRDLFYLVVLAYHHCLLPDDLVKADTAVTALRGMTAESALRITEDRWLGLSPEAQKILRMIAPKACPATRPQLECSPDWDDFFEHLAYYSFPESLHESEKGPMDLGSLHPTTEDRPAIPPGRTLACPGRSASTCFGKPCTPG
jgi:hypothetical protein